MAPPSLLTSYQLNYPLHIDANHFSACVTIAEGSDCQPRIASIESSSKISIYNLNTVGVTKMITEDGQDLADFSDNTNSFTSSVALFRN